MDERGNRRQDLIERGRYTHRIKPFDVGHRRLGCVVAEELEINSPPVLLNKIDGSLNRDGAEIHCSVHIENHAALSEHRTTSRK